MAPNPFQEGGCGITSRYMILYVTQLTCTILDYTVLCRISFLQWWGWHPIPFKKLDLAPHLSIWYYAILNWYTPYYTLLYYTGLSFAKVEMTSNPFQEGEFGIPPHYMIPYYIQLTFTILCYTLLYHSCAILYLSFCNGGDGTQSLSRRWDLASHLTIWY